MGYYTNYTLNVHDTYRDQSGCLHTSDVISDQVARELEEAVANLGVFREGGDSMFGWSIYDKWYDYGDDMLSLSRKFPTLLFTLFGAGDYLEDMWYTYYLNGQVQYAPVRFEYDEFSEDKLCFPKQEEGETENVERRALN